MMIINKKGKKIPIDDMTIDYVESDVSEFPNQINVLSRTDKTGFGLYEYKTKTGSYTHKITKDKIVRQFEINGVRKTSRRRR